MYFSMDSYFNIILFLKALYFFWMSCFAFDNPLKIADIESRFAIQ